MIIVYTPEGGEEERYDARKILTSEASIVANTVGLRWAQVKAGLVDDDPEAMRGVVWVMKKRATPTLRFKDFDPGVDEMVTRYDQREVADYIAEALKVTDASDGERQAAFQVLVRNAVDPEHAQALLDELTEGGAPKEQPAKKQTSKSAA